MKPPVTCIKLILIILLFFCQATALHAQKKKDILELINTVHATSKHFYSEIPFEYRNDLIIIKVKIGTAVYDYVFDTGGYNDITDDIQNKNNFRVISTETVGSANKLKAKVNIVQVDSLAIGDLQITNLAALQMNFSNSPSMCGINGALIGASIIKNFCWQIDFLGKKLVVTDDLSELSLPANAVKVPVSFNNRLMPFIEAELNGKKEKLMFDMGSSTLLSLTGSTAKKYVNGKNSIGLYGGVAEGGNGIVKTPVRVFQANSFNIGNGISYTNKPVVFTDLSNENLIGNPIIRDFIVTLNFKDNELYLAPAEHQKGLNGWLSFGLKIEYTNNTASITSIYEGLAAEKAGLKIGDEVMAIDNTVLDCKQYCDCRTAIDKALQEKMYVTLKIKAGNTVKEIQLKKEQVY